MSEDFYMFKTSSEVAKFGIFAKLVIIYTQMDDQIDQPPIDGLLYHERGRRNRPDLTLEEKRRIVQFFLRNCTVVDGEHVPARGTSVAAANFFGIDRTTAAKI